MKRCDFISPHLLFPLIFQFCSVNTVSVESRVRECLSQPWISIFYLDLKNWIKMWFFNLRCLAVWYCSVMVIEGLKLIFLHLDLLCVICICKAKWCIGPDHFDVDVFNVLFLYFFGGELQWVLIVLLFLKKIFHLKKKMLLILFYKCSVASIQ